MLAFMQDEKQGGSDGMKYALIGAAGYIAPRHMKAIRDTGGDLVAAFDPRDSVGIMDSYFPQADFFVEFERFDRHLDKCRRNGLAVNFVSICSPNYLHDAHIRFALRNDADAICEKPLVLNPWNLDALRDIEAGSGKKIYNILQLRLHPMIRQLRERVWKAAANKIYDVDLTYITSRGHWYAVSWKGDEKKSGGVATNIGVHFFDMLGWVFGPAKSSTLHAKGDAAAAGYIDFERARVRWFLSIEAAHLPPEVAALGKRTYRSVLIDGEELEFSEGFADLHTESYRHILSGTGFGLEDVRPSIEMVHAIRHALPSGPSGDRHPFAAKIT